MRKIYIVLLMIFAGSLQLVAQTIEDQSQIVQLCVNISELQSVYPQTLTGICKSIFAVAEENIELPQNIKITTLNARLTPVSHTFIQNQKIMDFVVFKKLDFTGNDAIAEFEYRFSSNSENNVVYCKLTLNKTSGAWKISTKECRKDRKS